MPRIGPFEAGIILVIIVIIFGVGRLAGVGAGLGKGMREFRQALSGKGGEEEEDRNEQGKAKDS